MNKIHQLQIKDVRHDERIEGLTNSVQEIKNQMHEINGKMDFLKVLTGITAFVIVLGNALTQVLLK